MKIFGFKFEDFGISIIEVFEEFVRIDIDKDLEFVGFEEFEEFVRIEFDIDLEGLNYIFERFGESFSRIKESVITFSSNLLLSSI